MSEDLIAIQQTLNRYTIAAGNADWDMVVETFIPDGVWEVKTMNSISRGHAEMRAAMSGFVNQMDYFVQINSPAVIELEGDRATARSAIRECGKFADRDETMEVVGFYDDQLVRTSEGWKFAHRVFTAAGINRFALLV